MSLSPSSDFRKRLAEQKAALAGRLSRGLSAAPAAVRSVSAPAAPLAPRAIRGAAAAPRRAPESSSFVGTGTRRALLVAVDRTKLPNYETLHGCKPDAKNLAAACMELGGWSRENVRTLADADATIANVRNALHELAETARPGDVVLYAQAGHGDRKPSRPPHNDACLALHDAEFWEEDFRSDLLRFRAGVRLVVLIDTCHSAGMFETGRGPSPASRAIFSPSRFAAVASSSPRGGIRETEIGWITASSGDQVSDDLGTGGYFTTTLVSEGWRKGGALGFEDSLSGLTGEIARRTAFERLAAPRAAAAPGTVTFLDLALYAAQSWRYFHPSEQQPQFHNPDLLRSVVAGRTGTRMAQ